MSVQGAHSGGRELSRAAESTRPAVPSGPYLVMGLGKAGRTAVEALVARSGPSSVLVWDDSSSDEVRKIEASLAKRGIAAAADGTRALDRVRAVIKSPGISMDHPVVATATRRGLPVLDELELGWRISSQPLVAVTGTDGKSTTAALVIAALEAAGEEPLLTGNVEGFRGAPSMSGVPPEHHGWLVAEVSSYQAGGSPALLPSAAVLTNLTEAHLTWHRSMTSYAAAKRRMFVRGERAVELAVLNADDAFGRQLAQEVEERGGRALTFGFAPGADWRIRSWSSTLRTGTVELDALGEPFRIDTRLPGAHNATNVAAALALADGLGLPEEATLSALASAAPVPGRFEPIDEGQPFDVVVDFAHTPAAVQRTLETAREIVARRRGRVIAVMGKVGRGERPYDEGIGRAARSGANHVVICASSLRGEPPLIELEGVLAGAREADGGDIEVVLDRRRAIARGLSAARPGDLVAILGRGGRRRMTYDTKGPTGSFDDREVAGELLREMK